MKNLYTLPLALIATGCAFGPNWTHPQIADQSTAQRQLIIDKGECTRVSLGNVPLPQISPNNSSQVIAFTANGSSLNTFTGETTFNSYSGQATTMPSGGFAGGFASGVANGAALGALWNARAAQEQIYQACMYSKGWVEGTSPAINAGSSASQAKISNANRLPAPPLPVYSSEELSWNADVNEFMNFYPAYRDGQYFDLLNERVKKLAITENLSGSMYLVKALAQLREEGLNAIDEVNDPGKFRALYLKSVAGDASAQAKMGFAYAESADIRIPVDYVRSAHWSLKAATSGNYVGQIGYGLMLFNGLLGQSDRINGYLWVKRAQDSGADAVGLLNNFKSQMTLSELEAVE